MKGSVLSYKIFGLLFVLMLSCTTVIGAEYRGDQSISPLMRFLRGLFWGGSGTATRFEHSSQGKSYQFSSLSLGSSKTGASLSSGTSSQQDIWAGYGQDLTSTVSAIKTGSTRTRSLTSSNNGTIVAKYSSTNSYINPLSVSTVESFTASSGSSGSSTTDVSSVSMPSVLTMQRASSQITMATMTTTNSSSTQTHVDTDGFGTNGTGATEPEIQTPVGDGSWVLLFLASLYVYLKRKRFFGQVFHT
ncbi:MAG: hypothetical protein H6Q17_1514 [Bacteroidetes bacterium]|nr:hypothetical protein [Bacteroidota bacterium]